ncbi:MAG TPA: hypothetical protein VGF56_04785 [Rhizomicrobium sp.]|jgi:hypothetical protein
MSEAVTTPQAGKPVTGAALVLAALVSASLLAIHPGGAAQDFPSLLQEETANRALDALVHGGVIVVLAVELVGYAVFARRVDRTSSLAALIFFAMGTAFFCASMVLDGLVIPALAAKYLPVPAKYDAARSLFALCGILIQFLMPLGLGFQAASIAAWGWALIQSRAARIAGGVGLLASAALLAGLALQPMNPLVLMGGVAVVTLWAFLMGVLGMRRAI